MEYIIGDAEGRSSGMNPVGYQKPYTLNLRELFNDMLNILRQADAVRLGVDLSGKNVALQYDIQALPGTLPANTLSSSLEFIAALHARGGANAPIVAR